MQNCVSLFFFLFGLFVALPQSFGETYTSDQNQELVYYSADIINANLINDSAELTGNVRVLFDNYELSAKKARIFKKSQTLKAWGDVRIEGNDSFVEAREVSLNYKTKKGDFKGVHLTSGQMSLHAETVTKINDNVYEATKAKFTACTTCPPAWSVRGKKMKLDITQYIEIKGGRFQILNQSLLPLPHLVLPINTRRKTGFITPSLNRPPGNAGSEFSQPYFWAIDPHRDLTVTPMLYFDLNAKINEGKFNYEKTNGGKLHLEYRQWLSNRSQMSFKTAYMYDDSYIDVTLNPGPNINRNRPTSRWFFSYENFFVLPDETILKSDITLLNEREYLNHFINEVPGRGLSALKNTVSLSKIKNNQFTSAEVIFYKNLLVEDPFDNSNDAIQKLPELRHSISETPIWNSKFLFKSDLQYTNFYRNGTSFDEIAVSSDPNASLQKDIDLAGDGFFDPSTDLLRTGHRLRYEAEISSPFKLGRFFDVLPKLSYRDSLYKFDLQKERVLSSSRAEFSNFASARYLELSTSTRTEFSKVYGSKFKHKVIPDLTLRVGTNINSTNSSFFQNQDSVPYHRQFQPITDDDFFNFTHGVQFDYWDRFFRAEVAEFSLTNILIKKNKQDFITYYDQPFYFNLTQSYDFRNARLEGSSDPWSNLNGILKLRSQHIYNLTQASYFYKSETINLSTDTTFTYLPGRFFSVGYSDFITVDAKGNLTDNRTKNISLSLGWEFPSLKLSGKVAYSLLEKQHLGWEGNLFYTPRGKCWGTNFNIFQLAGSDDEPAYRFSFFFDFGKNQVTERAVLNI